MSFLGSYFASVGFALFEWRCGFGGCSWASVSCAVSYFGIIHQLIYNDKQRGSGGSRSHLVGGGWSGTQQEGATPPEGGGGGDPPPKGKDRLILSYLSWISLPFLFDPNVMKIPFLDKS